MLTACAESDPSDRKTFEWDLRGTWTSNDPGGIYSGVLTIDYNRITISGYGENQTPETGNDARRPFRNLPRGIPLQGYSEDGYIHIMYIDNEWMAIPFSYQSLNYGQYRLLHFTFGDRTEILQREGDN